MTIVYKKSLYNHHASLNYYRSNIINFGYLSYKIHMSQDSLCGINVFPTGPRCFLPMQFNEIHELQI